MLSLHFSVVSLCYSNHIFFNSDNTCENPEKEVDLTHLDVTDTNSASLFTLEYINSTFDITEQDENLTPTELNSSSDHQYSIKDVVHFTFNEEITVESDRKCTLDTENGMNQSVGNEISQNSHDVSVNNGHVEEVNNKEFNTQKSEMSMYSYILINKKILVCKDFQIKRIPTVNLGVC